VIWLRSAWQVADYLLDSRCVLRVQLFEAQCWLYPPPNPDGARDTREARRTPTPAR